MAIKYYYPFRMQSSTASSSVITLATTRQNDHTFKGYCFGARTDSFGNSAQVTIKVSTDGSEYKTVDIRKLSGRQRASFVMSDPSVFYVQVFVDSVDGYVNVTIVNDDEADRNDRWNESHLDAALSNDAVGNTIYIDDLGVDNTGVVSATSRIQDAVNAVISLGGGVVQFGTGTYLVGSVWSTDSVTFKGVSPRATNILSDNTGAEYGYLWFNSGSEQPSADDVIVGASSAATAIVIADDTESGTYGGGNATGRLYCKTLTGAFTFGEDINIQGGTSNVLTTQSTWQAPIFLFAGATSDGDTAFNSDALNATFEFGGVMDMKISAANGIFTTDDTKLGSRSSSWLKKVTLTNGNGTGLPANLDAWFDTGTSLIRGMVVGREDSGGVWGSGTGTGAVYIDFAEGISGDEGSDHAYPGPGTSLTATETITFYDMDDSTVYATATVGTQTDAFDRDIIGVDFSSYSFGYGADIKRVWMQGLHWGVMTAQDERSMELAGCFGEGCTGCCYILKNHPEVLGGRYDDNLFGITGQNVFDLNMLSLRVNRSFYGVAAYSIRPGLTINPARCSYTGCSFGNYFYDIVGSNRQQIGNTRFLLGYQSQRACLFFYGDAVGDHSGGVISGCEFDHSDAQNEPKIAYIWSTNPIGQIVNCNFKLFGAVGILCSTTLAHIIGTQINNCYFTTRGGIPILVKMASEEVDGVTSWSFFSSQINSNFFYSPSAAATAKTTILFSGMANETAAVGDTITGGTSGATATVDRIIFYRVGDVAGSDARGVMIVSGVSGTFTAGGEALTFGSTGTCTLPANGAQSGEPAILVNSSAFSSMYCANFFRTDSGGTISYGIVTEDTSDRIKDNIFYSGAGGNGIWMATIDDSTHRTSYTDNDFI